MKISSASLHHYRLPLRTAWVTASGAFARREGWLLRLTTDTGRKGHGDCAPLPGSSSATPADTASELRTRARRLIGVPAGDALQTIDSALRRHAPAVSLAIETALLDLLAQAAGLPLATCLRGDQTSAAQRDEPLTVAVNAALGSIAEVRDDVLRTATAEGFKVLKLKVGMADVDDDVNHLQRLAKVLPAAICLRLDANRAWHRRDAERFLHGCHGLPIEMLEEPLAEPGLEQLGNLQAATGIAIAIDESASLLTFADILRNRPVRRLVIKPTRTGGLLPALALARRASHAGLQCIVTSSVESACGVTAAAQLALALDNDLAHGLATSGWLVRNTGVPPIVGSGRLTLPNAAGLAFTPDERLVFSDVSDTDPA